jgi:hypothetical protein
MNVAGWNARIGASSRQRYPGAVRVWHAGWAAASAETAELRNTPWQFGADANRELLVLRRFAKHLTSVRIRATEPSQKMHAQGSGRFSFPADARNATAVKRMHPRCEVLCGHCTAVAGHSRGPTERVDPPCQPATWFKLAVIRDANSHRFARSSASRTAFPSRDAPLARCASEGESRLKTSRR